MKTLYRGALVLWLVSGFAIHAYFSRAAQGTAKVEEKRDLHLRQFENDDAVARRIREAHWDAESKMAAGYAGWALVGFLLALPGVHSLFRRADRIADVEKFLAASLVLLLLVPRGAPAATPGYHVGRLQRNEIARGISDPEGVAQYSPGSPQAHPGDMDVHRPDRRAG